VQIVRACSYAVGDSAAGIYQCGKPTDRWVINGERVSICPASQREIFVCRGHAVAAGVADLGWRLGGFEKKERPR
jgi:hypothetical protein